MIPFPGFKSFRRAGLRVPSSAFASHRVVTKCYTERAAHSRYPSVNPLTQPMNYDDDGNVLLRRTAGRLQKKTPENMSNGNLDCEVVCICTKPLRGKW